MRSFLMACILAAGGVFGYKNLDNVGLNPNDPVTQTSKHIDSETRQLLNETRRLAGSGEVETAIKNYRSLLDNPQVKNQVAKELRDLYQAQGETRKALTLSYLYADNDIDRQSVLKELSALNKKMMNPNDTHAGIRHIIESGETLAKIASRYGSNERLLKRVNSIKNANLIHSGRSLKVVPVNINCKVRLSTRSIEIYLDEESLYMAHSVGIGKPDSPTPLGTFKVSVMQTDPEYWSTPGQPPIPSGDPRNPLGSRWMGFEKPYSSYGIHGTIDKDSVGKPSSNGCVRMARDAVEELYDMANYGMVVIISDE